MNMITFTARDRSEIIQWHQNLADALESQNPEQAEAEIDALRDYTIRLGRDVKAARDARTAAEV